MADLPPEMAALLDQARHAHDPSEADQARVQRSLAVALAVPVVGAGMAGGGAAGGAGSTAGGAGTAAGGAGTAAGGAVVAGAGKAGLTLGAKVALGSLLLAGLGSAVAVLPRAPAKDLAEARVTATQYGHAEHTAEGVASPGVPQRDAVVVAAPANVATHAARPEAPAEHTGPRTHRAERAERAPHALHALDELHALDVEPAVTTPEAVTDSQPTPAAAPVLSASALEELELIRRATRELRDGDAPAALLTLKQHAARHPEGALGLERDGLRVLALCAIEPNAEARALRTKFLDQHGASTMALRVRAACEPSGEPGAAP